VSGSRATTTDQANPLTRVDTTVVALRLGFQLLGPLFPGRAARVAERLFTTPPHHALRPSEESFLSSGSAFAVPHAGSELACWRWGDGPAVLLMHGWGSRAGRFRHFVPALLGRGFSAIAFDGPGHGHTGGRSASLPQFAAAIEAVVSAMGPVRGMIGHSLGGAAALFAMSRSVPAVPAVLIAAPADPSVYWRRFARHLRIPRVVRARTQHNLEQRFGLAWPDLDLVPVAARLPTPLLVLHDTGDDDVPLANGVALAEAAPHGTLVVTEGLGHRDIMRAPVVIRQAVEFLATEVKP
jgi:pimeloyl-ACP methyl ester carboxylesterase